ncbi:MAG: glycosyltransferase, partial [Pseudanabaenaceae cyanobacterium]
ELLALFYSQASVFVYPSYYEGFGLPVLEAMNWGTPVVTSNISSLPEVVGDAGLMVDPRDAEHIGEALWQIISDQELSAELSQAGQARANLFSWERTAQETLKAYKTIL